MGASGAVRIALSTSQLAAVRALLGKDWQLVAGLALDGVEQQPVVAQLVFTNVAAVFTQNFAVFTFNVGGGAL